MGGGVRSVNGLYSRTIFAELECLHKEAYCDFMRLCSDPYEVVVVDDGTPVFQHFALLSCDLFWVLGWDKCGSVFVCL
jgi:hypothetical protein